MPRSRLSRRDFLSRVPSWAAGAWALSRGRLLAGEPAAAAAASPKGEWLAGDFHCHTVLSHDVWTPGDQETSNDELYTWGWTAGEQIAIAESRGLDFLAITDHDRVDTLRLPDYASSRLTLVPGYEHSLAGGHAGVLVHDRALLSDIVRDADGSKSFEKDAGLLRFLAAVRERDGLAVLNHPFYGNEEEGEALAWGYGVAASRRFDALEVWNIGWPARHDTVRFADPDNYLSAPWWEKEFVRTRRTPAIGGSDNHWRSTTAAQGVGQPTTWVYATSRSPRAILNAVRAGRTTISAEPPAMEGTRLLLDAHEDWRGGRRAMVGGAVRGEGPLEVVARVENGTGGRLRIISTGRVVATRDIAAPSEEHRFRVVLPPRGWVRAEAFLHEGLWMSAMTNAIHTSGRAPAFARAEPTRGEPVTYGGSLLPA